MEIFIDNTSSSYLIVSYFIFLTLSIVVLLYLIRNKKKRIITILISIIIPIVGPIICLIYALLNRYNFLTLK